MKRARDAAGIGVLRSGVAQLGSQPLSKWYGTTMPPGSRIRFADPSFGPRALGGQGSLAGRARWARGWGRPATPGSLALFDRKQKILRLGCPRPGRQDRAHLLSPQSEGLSRQSEGFAAAGRRL